MSFRILGAGALLAGLLLAVGCGDDVKNTASSSDDDDGGSGGSGAAGGSGGTGGTIPPAPPASQVDLLLAVDNSRSMADKQEILALTVPDLVSRFVNPLCIGPNGEPAPNPGGPLDECPPGFEREFSPILDIHIGVVTSSLGGHGADACQGQTATGCASGTNTSNNDRGHLITRIDPCSAQEVPTWADKKFLAWDPTGKKSPPGEGDIVALSNSLQDMVIGAGQIGCGYESQLESVLRFLVDPAPYASITTQNNSAEKQGVDDVLLQQRKDFLRPASMLAVVMLSDENDCSTREYGQYFYANLIKNGDGSEFHLPKARSECAANPLDPCCKSCGQDPGSCGPDPNCPGTHDSLSDNINVRCFDQKRRFGIDFLYPIERYVNAFSKPSIDLSQDSLDGPAGQPNPIFMDLTGANGTVRDPTLVFFTGIVGVPWQLIAKDPQSLASGFMNAAELSQTNTWQKIVGNPSAYVLPTDPHMMESIDPRPGLPTSGGTDPVHGNEHDTSAKRDDLQYTCILPLAAPRDCSDPAVAATACDCHAQSIGTNNPLCAPNPNDGGQSTLQVSAKAYPSLRQLAVIQGLGAQGVTASICPAELGDATSPVFGYRPAVAAFIDAAKHRLAN